ncbi:ABC transporter permease [Aneurinibacillus migulanus]|uniref:Monosaccharide ABC transporter membrane protein, CUT2 family (TC 3.A.1.2.-) n=1 Tax=Aneurinibacillus migulanus TaxID=47500 RepID=A0A0D1XH59_ANEMI|nr:ABC transporter permease [Aneurinibacillus migulanus]KIV53671.1 sugar ABC transporter permease [Aneurinibacillus migulanus]KON97672.1 sugar ABC transporter permease [Aneurinibacillus migulanus]MED0894428.1 ABC transporter permease [Aneurinibacillus migulanus]MED1617038.1 ABC transporter permease [Aneurinibacillus migulanus]SDJ35583.1 monosaccharide ABC transporter membrane protein, CUT2 family (TC 3.A.1.2.-) [Aneurinibacillus migulanus]
MSEVVIKEQTSPKKSFAKNFAGKFGPFIGLILLCVILTILSSQFLTLNNIMNIARQSSINALLALGLLLPILTAGIDLSVGSILALSIMTMGIVSVNWGLPPLLGILVCLVVGTFLGWTNGILLTKLRLPHPFISTLGMMNVARGIALIVTAAAPIAGFPVMIQFIGNEFAGPIPISFVLVIVMYIIFHYFLTRTATGRYIYAIGGNKEAARLSGINVDRVLIIVYTLSGLMASLAGLVLVGRVNSAFPLAGMGYELDAIAACIIGGASFFGGVGTVWGTLIGAFIIAVLRNGLNLLNVSADLQMALIGVVIIAAVYVDVLRQRSAKK